MNWIYGYRTVRSMKSQEAWDASNKYSMDLMIWIAVITIICQVVTNLLFEPATALLIACSVMCVLLVGIVVVVEKYLKENFDDEGKPKS
ncbi:SdpI family protein [Ekhidna sp.]|uniref:SdpI family protein n=1 Tax=Ekhidna sp. TaxID=2608089 RepID=UPI003CCBE57D